MPKENNLEPSCEAETFVSAVAGSFFVATCFPEASIAGLVIGAMIGGFVGHLINRE